MTLRSVIYARTSSTGSQECRQSTDRQVYSLSKLIHANGHTLVKTFEDHVSGATINKDRFILNECLQFAVNNKVDISTEEHIYNIRKQQSDLYQGICPRCGGRLVLRKGKYGEFWGCSNYPKCKFNKND